MTYTRLFSGRKFGTSKRFSELDKKDVTELIAIKIQVSKEEWKQEMDLIRQQLQAQMDAVKRRDQQVDQYYVITSIKNVL
jgi:hypothetical protein